MWYLPDSDSPLVNSGDNNAWTGLETAQDQRGSARVADALVEIGAIEIQDVKAQHVFYNDSSLDGDDPLASSADDDAIDSGRSALLPGDGAATAANYTTYTKGLNGIMVDFSGPADDLTLADFSFRAGNTTNPASFVALTGSDLPDIVATRAGDGVDGSDRATLIWKDNNPVVNRWLEVTVKANDNTRLGSDYVFYLGNLVGDVSGDMALTYIAGSVNPTDDIDLIGVASLMAYNATFDVNKDGVVDSLDVADTLVYGAGALPGDANLDGIVNGTDVSILASAFGQSGPFFWVDLDGSGTFFYGADFNGDGAVNGTDLSIIASNFGLQQSPLFSSLALLTV